MGYSEEEAQVSTIEDWLKFIDPHHLTTVREALTKYFQNPDPVVEITYPMIAKDGSVAWIHTRGYAQIVSGNIQKIGGSHTNITIQQQQLQ